MVRIIQSKEILYQWKFISIPALILLLKFINVFMNSAGITPVRSGAGTVKRISLPAWGIHRRAYRRNGYICFACLSIDFTCLTRSPLLNGEGHNDAGFFVDSIGRLRACSFRCPTYSTVEVLEAIYKALLDKSYTSIDILLGGEAVHTWKILDAAEAAIGK